MFENVKKAAAVCRVYGDGQKVIASVIEFSEEISDAQITASDYQVSSEKVWETFSSGFEIVERNIQDIYVNNTGKPGEKEAAGRYLIIELDPADPQAAVRYRIGKGRDARMGVKHPTLKICYLPDQEVTETTEVIDEVADQFQLFRYQIPESEHYLDFQLFVPREMKEGESYPLVLFMHDMGACSDDPLAPLVQGNGATIWAEAEEQKKRPCFVVAPCYLRQCANDDFEVTWEADATISLIEKLCEKYPVDAKRIYGTGQSMGCMMLCELNLRYPDFFAGSYMVAGQWDSDRMGEANGQNIWALVSEYDEKAFPIMGACMDQIAKKGTRVLCGSIDAKADLQIQNAAFERLSEEPAHVFFTWYEGDSVLPENVEHFPAACHTNTWAHAYSLESVRNWLFAQKK